MSFYDAIRVGASGAADFEVERSLRFNDDDNAYLNRTPSGASNRTTFTLSVWVKRASNLDEFQRIFEAGADTSNRTYFTFDGDDKLEINHRDGGSEAVNLTTTARFRDVSAWYHIVLAIDTTQSTSSDRIKIYVNGTQQTAFDTSTYPSSSKELDINSTAVHYIGRTTNNTSKFNGYMAEFNFIDGSQLTPSSFGATDVLTGQWNPKKYTGSYGTNGFRLNFSDNSGTTATTLGKDASGNSNNFTPNNFGTGDAVKDTPTNNFCTLSAIFDAGARFGSGVLSEAGLRYTGGSSNRSIGSTFGIRHTDTQGYYFEARIISGNEANRLFVGIGYTSTNWINTDARGASDDSWVLRNGDGAFLHNGSSANDNGATSVGDIIQIAVKGNKIWVGTNNTYHASGNPSAGTNEKFSDIASTWTPVADVMTSNVVQFNFGQDSSFSNTVTAQGNADANGNGDFYYSPPTGFLALCSANLPDPTILLPNKHFDTLLYSGNSSTNAITGLNYQPDWVWIKRRNGTNSHQVYDAVRGVAKNLRPDTTNAEADTTAFVSFDSNGFELSGSTNAHNASGNTYVAWNWNAGNTDSATYRVVVVSDSGNKYRFRNSANTATFAQSAVVLDLAEGGTYTFDQSDSTMSSHPMKLSTTANGTHGGGTSYNTGVTYQLDGSTVTESAFVSGFSSASSRKLIITVAASAPTLYYYCHYHSGMGGQANTNSTLGSSNFDGSTQTIVKANTTAGFSIVSYTGNATAGSTVGHGLGVKPDFMILRNRPDATNWIVYHSKLSTDGQSFLELNTTQDGLSTSTTLYNSTAPSSSVITLGTNNASNGNNDAMIVYAFSEVAGYSKFGSYTGNGDTEGTFVFTGFRPAWIMMKEISSSSRWSMYDNKRGPINPNNIYLRAQATNGDTTSVNNDVDFVSNGFKMRGTGEPNASSITYVYFAFAESPFKNSRAR